MDGHVKRCICLLTEITGIHPAYAVFIVKKVHCTTFVSQIRFKDRVDVSVVTQSMLRLVDSSQNIMMLTTCWQQLFLVVWWFCLVSSCLVLCVASSECVFASESELVTVSVLVFVLVSVFLSLASASLSLPSQSTSQHSPFPFVFRTLSFSLIFLSSPFSPLPL